MEEDKWEKDSLDIDVLSKKEMKIHEQLSNELGNKPVWDFSDTLQNN